MKLLSSLLASVYLYEANVLNGNQEFFGTSIEKYLAGIAESLSTPELQKTFMKKIGRLLLNDERFLHAVREIPDNAPDWAKNAPAGELMYFQPSPELTDALSNIAHYLDAVALSARSTDPDTKAYATGELNGFVKVETIDLLSGKAAAFWKRGSNKVGREVDGLKEVIAVGGGFVWYELDSSDSFVRAGKALQNCIGSHWSHAKCREQGAHIFVLRDKNGDTVVAVRTDRSNVIQEIKGKNNKPPVEKYVPAITSFLQTPSTSGIASSSGQHDLANVGYIIHERKLYTFREATRELVKKKIVIGPTSTHPDGVEVVRLEDLTNKSTAQNDAGYGRSDNNQVINLLLKFAGIAYHGGNNTIYGLHRNQKITAIAVVNNYDHKITRVSDLTTPITVKESDQSHDTPAQSDSAILVQMLLDSPHATDTDGDVDKYMLQRHQYLATKDPETQRRRYEPVEQSDDPSSDDEVVVSQIGKKHAQTYVGALMKIAKGSGYDSSTLSNVSAKAISNSDAVYVVKPRNQQTRQGAVLIALDKDNRLAYPLDINLQKTLPGSSPAEAAFDYTPTATVDQADSDIKTTAKAVVNFANNNKVKLPLVYTAINGIRKNKNNEYEFFEPESEKLPGGGQKWDLSKMGTTERIATLFYANHLDTSRSSQSIATRLGGNRAPDEAHFVRSPFEVVPQVHDVIGALQNRVPDEYSYTRHHNASTTVGVLDHKDDEKWFAPAVDAPKKGDGKVNRYTPFNHPLDAIYLLPVQHGPAAGRKKMNVVMLVNKGKVFSVSRQVMMAQWQTWADNSDVATQLATFAKANNLTFDKDAFTPFTASEHSSKNTGEIIVGKDGIPTTKEDRHASRLERGQVLGRTAEARTSEVPMSNGTKWIKLPAKENATQLRSLFAANSGSVWQLEDTELKVLISGKSIKQIALGTKKDGIPFDNAPAIAGLGHALGVEVLLRPWVTYATSPIIRRLKELYRGYSRRKDTSGYKNLKGDLAPPPGVSTDDALIRKGWARTVALGINGVRMEITDTGRQTLAASQRGEKRSILPVKILAPAEGFAVPEKQPRVTPTPAEGGEARVRAPRAAGGETKADQALALYRQMTDDAGGTQPARAAFIRVLMADPFNMSAAGASTYQYTTKQKYLRSIGQVAETMTFIGYLLED